MQIFKIIENKTIFYVTEILGFRTLSKYFKFPTYYKSV
jgi:hypothetical protein